MADDTKWYDNNYVKAAGVAAGAISNIAAGGRTTGVGNAMSTIGTGLSALPGPAGLVGMGLNVAGGIFNTLAGAKFNEKNIAAVESNTNTLRNFNSNASTYDQLADNISNMAGQMAFDDKFIGSWGILGGRGKVARKAEKLRQDQRNAFNYAQATIENNMNNIATTQTQDMLANYAANGGPLVMHKGALTPFGNRFDEGGSLRGPLHSYGTDWDDGLTFVNTGGTHEQNPNDGVQMGMDEEGTPNLVEEGEVVWNDYVFSKRMKVPKAIRSKYKLREQKELSYADAVKKEQKALEERPNDPIEKRTVDDMLLKLAVAQEEQRQTKEMRRQQREQQQALQYAYGGITIKPSKRGTFTTAAKKHGKSVQEFASQVLANPEDYSPAMRKKANFAKNAAGWKHGFGSWLKRGPSRPGLFDNTIEEDFNPRFLQLHPEDQIDGYVPSNNRSNRTFNAPVTVGVTSPYGNTTMYTGDSTSKIGALPKKAGSDGGADVDNPYKGSWLTNLRYAPVLGSALGVFSDLVGLTNKPDYSSIDAMANAEKSVQDIRAPKIGDYMAYNPFDRMFYLNQLNANAGASRRALLNTTAGNRGAAAANILASDYANIGKIGDLARTAEEYNLGQREKVAAFNRETNKTNADYEMQALMANSELGKWRATAAIDRLKYKDQLRDSVNANRAANFTGLFDNLGALGEDVQNRLDRDFLIKSGIFGALPIGQFSKLYGKDAAKKEAKRRGYTDVEIDKIFAANGGFIKTRKKRGLTI